MSEITAVYDVYESPSPDDSKKRSLHVRLVTSGTVDTQRIAEDIHYSSSLTVGDIVAVLTQLSHHMKDLLQQGKRVHIDGLGYFQMTLKCPPAKSAKDIKGNMVSFKSISFRPESNLKKDLKKTSFVRSNRRNIHSQKLSLDQMKDILKEYFKDHSYITRSVFERLCSFTESTARNKLQQLTEEGILKREGIQRFPIYVWGKDE